MKTPDEIKKGMECCRKAVDTLECPQECPYYKDDCDCGSKPYQDCVAYIQQLEAQVPRWISVEERLPEENAEVLCCCKMQKGDVYYTLGVNYRNGWSFDNDPYAEHDQTVTHWMPLPEPPKEE